MSFEFDIYKVADTLRVQAKFFNCGYKEAWENYMHPAITEPTTFDEVWAVIDRQEKEEELIQEITELKNAVWAEVRRYRIHHQGKQPSHILVSFEKHTLLMKDPDFRMQPNGKEMLFGYFVVPSETVHSFKVVGGLED